MLGAKDRIFASNKKKLTSIWDKNYFVSALCRVQEVDEGILLPLRVCEDIKKQLTQPLKVEYVINMEILLQGMNEVIQIKAPLLIRLVGEHIKSAAHQSKKKKP